MPSFMDGVQEAISRNVKRLGRKVDLADLLLDIEAMRVELAAVTDARNVLTCDHEEADPQATACWKLEPHWVAPDDCEHRPHRPQEEWCEACTQRQAHHEHHWELRRKIAGKRSALTRKARNYLADEKKGGN